MSLSLAYALFAFSVVFVVFLAIHRRQGIVIAFVAGGLCIPSVFALFATLIMIVTRRMG